MNRLLILIFIAWPVTAICADFDNTVVWTNELPFDSAGISSADFWEISGKGVSVSARHSNPYMIKGLSWEEMYGRIGFGRWGIFGRLNYYGLKYNYDSLRGGLTAVIRIKKAFIVGINPFFETEKFGSMGRFDRAGIGFDAGCRWNALKAVAGIKDINLSVDYKSSSSDFRPWAAVTYSFRNGVSLAGSVQRFENRRYRWLFGQRILISKTIDLTFGVINRPDLLFGMMSIEYGNIAFDVAYYSVGRLRDTLVMGLTLAR